MIMIVKLNNSLPHATNVCEQLCLFIAIRDKGVALWTV